jgi:hypothetical protein
MKTRTPAVPRCDAALQGACLRGLAWMARRRLALSKRLSKTSVVSSGPLGRYHAACVRKAVTPSQHHYYYYDYYYHHLLLQYAAPADLDASQVAEAEVGVLIAVPELRRDLNDADHAAVAVRNKLAGLGTGPSG